MIARLADPYNDTEQIMLGVRDFVSRMDYTEFLPPEEVFGPFIVQLLGNSSIETAVVEHEGALVAGMGIAYIPFVWNPTLTQAEEMFFWAHPDAPKAAAMKVLRFTLSRIRERARSSGNTVMANFGTLTSSPESLGRVYNKLGLRETATMYAGCF